MTLEELDACFEGVIPSILATTAADGTPNISYLSHVGRVDAAHVALSNQFFSKTARNIAENPRAALLVVDPRTGAQFRLTLAWRESVCAGPVFAHMAAQLRASSAQLGFGDVMRLHSADIWRVVAIQGVPGNPATAPDSRATALARAQAAVDAFADAPDLAATLDAATEALCRHFAAAAAMVLAPGPDPGRLVAIASRGYPRSGIGAEVGHGEGLIGVAAAEHRCLRISDLSRLRRLGAAAEAAAEQENRTRSIALATLADATSQIAVPMLARGTLRGVVFLESPRRLAFSAEDEAALTLVSRQLAATLALQEADGAAAPPTLPLLAPLTAPVAQGDFTVAHHPRDDSLFIDGAYLIRGVPARLLLYMLDVHQRTGRQDFANRELRADRALRLPDLKDNLETRLLLLRRRLEEKSSPLRLLRPTRGMVRLELHGRPSLLRVT